MPADRKSAIDDMLASRNDYPGTAIRTLPDVVERLQEDDQRLVAQLEA